MDRETAKQRWERNFRDLLQELRVAQTGVQILFAFLLILPFTSGFAATTRFQQQLYLVALLSAAGSTALTISPVAFHRALFRRGRKPELVLVGHRMAAVGLLFMLVAMVSSVSLIMDFLLNRVAALVVAGITAGWFVVLWVVLPLVSRRQDDEED